jgi:septum formation protein
MTVNPLPTHRGVESPFIYLASQSPRRAQLLEQLGVLHRPLQPEPQEDAESLEVQLAGELPTDYVVRVTRLKVLASLERLRVRQANNPAIPAAPVLCADTTVALGDEVFGKPANPAHASQMLEALSAQTHRVLTAVCIGLPAQLKLGAPILSEDLARSGSGTLVGVSAGEQGDTVLDVLSCSWVSFARLSDAQIEGYIQTGEPFGKAGAYAVQGLAAGFIEKIEGSYSGIMGLPLFECAQMLRTLGYYSL